MVFKMSYERGMEDFSQLITFVLVSLNHEGIFQLNFNCTSILNAEIKFSVHRFLPFYFTNFIKINFSVIIYHFEYFSFGGFRAEFIKKGGYVKIIWKTTALSILKWHWLNVCEEDNFIRKPISSFSTTLLLCSIFLLFIFHYTDALTLWSPKFFYCSYSFIPIIFWTFSINSRALYSV